MSILAEVSTLDEIAELEDLIDQLLNGLESVVGSGEVLTDEFQGQIANELSLTMQRIQSLKEESIQQEAYQPIEEQQQPTLPQKQLRGFNPPSSSAQLMWILSGQREDVFLQYLQTYPDPELQELLRNPAELENTIQQLHQMMPSGQPTISQEGIPHAEINSSNIFGFKYDPSKKSLLVKFQGNGDSGQGSVYKYDNVPLNVYKSFEMGAVPAKTNGQNKFGRWWVGKQPSLGAAFYDLIKQGGYQYQRVN